LHSGVFILLSLWNRAWQTINRMVKY
jgi:hypothetical protein